MALNYHEEHVTVCEVCHQDFDAGTAGISVCRECYFNGGAHETVYPVLLRDLRQILSAIGATAKFMFVGDGDFVLEVRGMGGFPIITGTVAIQTQTGWTTRPAVPDPGKPWAIALFRNMLQWPQYPEITKIPATDAELVQFVTDHQLDLDAFNLGTHCRVCGVERPCGCQDDREED